MPSLVNIIFFVLSFSIITFLAIQYNLKGYRHTSRFFDDTIKGNQASNCASGHLQTVTQHQLPSQCRLDFSEFEADFANSSLCSQAAVLSVAHSTKSQCVGVFKFSGTVCLQTLPFIDVGNGNNHLPVCIWSDLFLTNGLFHYHSCSKMPSTTISEPVVFLHVPYGTNFQHILQDALVPLALVRKQLTEREANDTAVLMYVDRDGGIDSWAHYIVIGLLGFKKIIVLQDDLSYCAQDPIIPVHIPDFSYGFFAQPALEFVAQLGADKLGIKRTAQLGADKLGIKRTDSSADKSCAFKIVYVTRPDSGKPSNGRNIRKQGDVVAVIRQWSQDLALLLRTSTCVSEFSGEKSLTKRQTHLMFREASVIVGVHGGGIAHIALSSLEAFIFEILVGGANARSYVALAGGHKNYHQLILPGYTDPDEREIDVPTDLLRDFLSRYSQEVLGAYNSSLSDTPAAAIGARTTPNPAPDHAEQSPLDVRQPAQQSAVVHPSPPLPPSSPYADTAPELEASYVAILDAAFSLQVIVARCACRPRSRSRSRSLQSSGWSHITTGTRFLRACTAHMRRLSDSRVSGSAAEGSDLRYIVCEPEKTGVGLGNRL
jgi:hypothetical protein